ncbi:ribosome maturation factor RimM [Rhodococcus sp. X156]|uniref:ribosome maturation factor RimM n=1 Tax=Rhodococcus sp. X156 TaxID=2499145 RepID=UPI000FD93ECB|nr:ribosome maturation factor RimM [Rhodococcus sp. X156]
MELVIGRVARAHGVHGEVVVEVRTDDPEERFAAGTVLHGRKPRAKQGASYTVAAARNHSGRLLLRLEEVADRAAADELRGTLFLVDSAELPPSDEPDAFYDHELEGLSVVLADGSAVGTVREVLHTPGGELLSVRPAGADKGEHLVPFVAAIVTEVDLQAGTVTIDPPDGLLEV